VSSPDCTGLTERGRTRARDAEGRGGAGGGRGEEEEGRSWPGEELHVVGDDGVRRSGGCCARASGGREREWRSANGSGGSGGRGRALLVADQGASRLPHARHVAATLCRRGRPRAGTARALAQGRG